MDIKPRAILFFGWALGCLFDSRGFWITNQQGVRTTTYLALARYGEAGGMLVLVVGPVFIGLWKVGKEPK